MSQFRLDSIAELARQMTFTPQEMRSLQVTSAETLLHELDTAKAYPWDYVVFRITGYHPKNVGTELLTGLALQHDLGLLIEKVSNTLNVRTASLAEPVLTIEDVTARFNVTSKTIQRWRRKGLPARRFLFPDGKRRVGFLLSSVERFVGTHTQQVAEASNFSQVDEAEREEIVRRARRLATQCSCCENEIARRIGRKLNRSPLTVQHTIRKHDAEHPGQAIFPQASAPLDDAQRAVIVRAYRRGVCIRRIARKLCRPTTAIYRVILEDRVARLNAKKIRFLDDPIYHQPDAEQAVEQIAAQEPIGERPQSVEETRVPRELPPYLQDLYRTPLLSPVRERGLFLKLNYRKYQFIAARRKLDESQVRAKDLNRLERLLRRVTETKNEILRANLRLVVSVARKHLRPGLSLMELVSDGNLTLMRAVDAFDVHRGTRFGTYATYALMKGYARSVPAMQAASSRAAAAGDLAALTRVADSRVPDRDRQRMATEEVGRLLTQLTDRERAILTAHWGVGGREPGASYEELARRLGLSSHRVRQIELRAIKKLRATAFEAS